MIVARDQGGDPAFAQFVEGGSVHVLREGLHTVDTTLGLPMSTVGWLLGRQWALCGAKSLPGVQCGIFEFADELLCSRCYRVAARLIDTDDLFRHA